MIAWVQRVRSLVATLVRSLSEDLGQAVMLVLYAALVIAAFGVAGLAIRVFKIAAGFE